jgi:CheY-like chemotaxis protein
MRQRMNAARAAWQFDYCVTRLGCHALLSPDRPVLKMEIFNAGEFPSSQNSKPCGVCEGCGWMVRTVDFGFEQLNFAGFMRPMSILHVEDDPDDAFFLRRALGKLLPECQVERISDGATAIKQLEQAMQSGKVPDLLVLDIKLPGLDGFEVLAWVRARDPFRSMPIVMLSGSGLDGDRRRAEALGAMGYLVKSSDFHEAAKAVLSFVPGQTPRSNEPP